MANKCVSSFGAPLGPTALAAPAPWRTRADTPTPPGSPRAYKLQVVASVEPRQRETVKQVKSSGEESMLQGHTLRVLVKQSVANACLARQQHDLAFAGLCL
jgi:hypothetical protein